MRLLWSSNAPWAPSGYGAQTLQVVKRLKAAGHDIAIASNYGLQARMTVDDSLPEVPVLPSQYDGIGNDILPAHYTAWRNHDGIDTPTYLITLYDVWPYQRERFREIPTASWVPVDHYPAPPKVIEWCQEHDTIAMSRFGQERLEAAGVTTTYIPHAIERDVYKPIDGAREALGYDEEAFIVLITAANKGNNPMRKAWNEMFGALAIFMAKHPDVIVHIHSEKVGAQSPDLREILDAWHIDTDRVNWTPQYLLKVGQIGPEDVNRLYNAADVLLATSMGEGFGVPVIEAQAAGTPVIVSNWTAQPELVGGGWIADVQPWWDVVQSSFLATPIISSIISRLEDAYEARGDQAIRQKALDKAAEYDADKVFEEAWVPFIASLEAKLAEPEKPKPLGRSERRRRAKAVA